MEDTNANPTPEPEQTATPATEPVSQEGTVQQASSEATEQGAPAEDSFTSVDRNTLTPENQQAYDNMLRDYKSKTAAVAEGRKSDEEVRQKAAYYDQIAQDEKFVKFYNGQAQETQPQNPITEEELDELRTTSDPERYKELNSKLSGSGQTEQIQKNLNALEAREAIREFSETSDKQGNKTYPNWGKYKDLGILNLLTNQVPKTIDSRDYPKALKWMYSEAEKLYNSARDDGRKEAQGSIERKVAQSTEVPAASYGEPARHPNPKGISIQEAIEAGFQGKKLY